MKKRKPISLKRLYILAIEYCKEKKFAKLSEMERITEYLSYVALHKEDVL